MTVNSGLRNGRGGGKSWWADSQTKSDAADCYNFSNESHMQAEGETRLYVPATDCGITIGSVRFRTDPHDVFRVTVPLEIVECIC